MARKKKLDLATAKQADGALPSMRQIEEMVGIKGTSYWEKSYGEYQTMLRSKNLIELHDHAFEVGVVPASHRDMMIDRLERKFLQENPDARDKHLASVRAGNGDTGDLPIEDQAKLILSRTR